MPEGWEWDETLYAGSAPYYRRGRLPYPPGLADLVAEVLSLDGRGRLIDVGSGPGVLALTLVHLFADVVGVEPDGDMIAEAERLACEAGVDDRTRWVKMRAEELPAGLGSFTVATFGQSFHWMERDLVAATVREMLRPGGAFVQVSDLKSEVRQVEGTADPAPPYSDLESEVRPVEDMAYPAPPYPAIRDLVKRYLGQVRRAGQGRLLHGTPGDEIAVLARAGFTGPERHVAPGGQVLERSAEDLHAWVFSRSDSAPHLFAGRRADFEADLDRLLGGISPTGRFCERQPSTEIFIWRR
jgi:ubiquinone/menaquinone biosynthesis C-methylase UbiE